MSLLRGVALGAVFSLLTACSDGGTDDVAASGTTADRVGSGSQSSTPSVSASEPSGGGQNRERQNAASTVTTPGRWYGPERVERGEGLFAQHCAGCHGVAAEGAFNWRQRDAEGKLPAPPLNGTGHAWHHPLRGLGSQIKFGTPHGMGTMPGFGDRLTDEEILDTIAWFQGRWPNEIYQGWMERQRRAREAER